MSGGLLRVTATRWPEWEKTAVLSAPLKYSLFNRMGDGPWGVIVPGCLEEAK